MARFQFSLNTPDATARKFQQHEERIKNLENAINSRIGSSVSLSAASVRSTVSRIPLAATATDSVDSGVESDGDGDGA